MMAERGIKVDYTTIMRWVHQYSPGNESYRHSGCNSISFGVNYRDSAIRHFDLKS